jgi:hypothetical protein
MEAILNLLKQQHPEMAPYFEMMQAGADKEPAVEEGVFEEIVAQKDSKLEKLEKINQRLFNIVQTLQQQLKAEMLHNDNLAKAIGACPECLGHQPGCNVCRGLGKPGYFVPDFVLYNKFVLPASKAFAHHFTGSN